MAEPTQFRTRRGTVIRLKSGDGTAKTHVLNPAEGSLTCTSGGYSVVRAKDENGNYTGAPRKGEQAGASMIAFSGRLFDAGDNSAQSVLADICRQTGDDGYIGSDWTSTDTDSDLQVYSLELELPTIGSNTGTKHLWTKVVVEPGCSWEVRPDGIFATLNFSSADAEAATTRLT